LERYKGIDRHARRRMPIHLSSQVTDFRRLRPYLLFQIVHGGCKAYASRTNDHSVKISTMFCVNSITCIHIVTDVCSVEDGEVWEWRAPSAVLEYYRTDAREDLDIRLVRAAQSFTA
jgi:hypothetical protein